jgi:hypothetical protein
MQSKGLEMQKSQKRTLPVARGLVATMAEIVSIALVFGVVAVAQTCPTWGGPWHGKLGKLSQRVEPHCMSDDEIEQLITLGKSYKSPDKLWDGEFRGNHDSPDAQGHPKMGEGNEFHLNSWYTATTLRVLTDSWKIASGALQAVHELRSFSVADARSMSYGTLVVSVLAADQGRKQNATRNVHAVLDLDGNLLQPASKSESNVTLYRWVGFGKQKNSTMNGEFTFALPDRHAPTARIVLIDNGNKQHFQVIDFSKLR